MIVIPARKERLCAEFVAGKGRFGIPPGRLVKE
jgi:hypothetical protein